MRNLSYQGGLKKLYLTTLVKWSKKFVSFKFSKLSMILIKLIRAAVLKYSQNSSIVECSSKNLKKIAKPNVQRKLFFQ